MASWASNDHFPKTTPYMLVEDTVGMYTYTHVEAPPHTPYDKSWKLLYIQMSTN